MQINRTNKTVTDDIIRDRFMNIPYKRLTLEEEIIYMKKLKLSYYYDVDEEKQEKYLKYYGEVKPGWYKTYKEASEEDKKKLLDKAINKSLEYREEFIRNNLRLVVSLAKSFQRADCLENLCQEGMVGLIKAVEYYDFECGNKFSSFAGIAIKRRILRYVQDNSFNIRIPNKKFANMKRLSDIELKEKQKTGELPSDEELMDIMGINQEQLNDLKRCREISRISSLDEPLDDDKTTPLGELIEDKDSLFEDKVDNSMMLNTLVNMLDTLDASKKDKQIMYLRYGLKDYKEPLSYVEVSKIVNLSVTRIRNIESRILKQLRDILTNQNEQELDLDKNNPLINKKFKKKDNLRERLEDEDFRYIRESIMCSNIKLMEPTSQYILRRVYGLDGICLTDTQIADDLYMSVRDVNIIENNTLKKLGIKPSVNISKFL